MATPYALLEQNLGAATAAMFCNASMELPGGAVLNATLTQPYADGVGNLAMTGRDVVIVCRTAQLNEPVAAGTSITVRQGVVATAWRVVTRTDVLETGDTQLQLETP